MMARNQRTYDNEYKAQAVKLAQEIGGHKAARKSDDLIKRDFTAEKSLEKCVTDMTEIKTSDGELYVSAIFDFYDLTVLGLAMDTNMKATLCKQTLDNAYKAYPMLRGAIRPIFSKCLILGMSRLLSIPIVFITVISPVAIPKHVYNTDSPTPYHESQ